MKRTAAILIGMLPFLPLGGTAAGDAGPPPPGQVSVVVTLRDRADLGPFRKLHRAARRGGVVRALREKAGRTQGPLRAHLSLRRAQGRVSRITHLWVANAVSVTAAPEVIEEIRRRPEVLAVSPDEIHIVPAAIPAGPPEPNLSTIKAPDLWSRGFLGQGVVVASMDTGVDPTNPDLAARWRGGANSWYDPYGQHPTPADLSGHGTWTMGVMVGGDAGGTAIGVAPEASWIAAKIFDDQGRATATAIHLGFQWLLDPDGDPATDDAPDFVNNSWSYGFPGCNLEFQPDLQALLAAGIVPVFAAGNYGPGAGTSVSPANYPEAFAVGAVDDTGAVLYDSSRGPSACGGGTFPAVVAPGANVLTSDRYGTYAYVSGTSIAAPHATGVMALLRSAFPATTAAQVELALKQSAADLGAVGPDDDSGYGLVDALQAYQRLAAPPPASPPTAADDAYAFVGGAASAVAAPGVLGNDFDPDGTPLAAVLVGGTAHGTLALQPDGGFTYTPDAGFSGADSFSYKAVDGLGESAPATVAITVAPPPEPPVASDDAFSVAENTSGSFTPPGVLWNDTSPSGRPLAAALVSGASHGSVALQASGAFTYTPGADYHGPDAFTYRAGDGVLESNTATVTLTVTHVNRPPVAVNDAATTSRNTAVTVNVVANDYDTDGSVVAGTVSIATGPRYGKVANKGDGGVVYTPNRRFRGTDSFTYTVKDDAGAASNLATVSVKVK